MLFHVLGVWEKSKPSDIVLRTDFQPWALWSNKFQQLIKTQTYDTEGIAFDFMYPCFSFSIQLLYSVGMETKDRKRDVQ